MTTKAAALEAAARHYLGLPYVWGSHRPTGMDCVGLVVRAFMDIGELPLICRNGVVPWEVGRITSLWQTRKRGITTHLADAKPGDMLIFGNNEHIGIYLGADQMISANVPKVAINRVELERPTLRLILQTGFWRPDVTPPAPTPPPPGPTPPPAAPQTVYVVRAGDTLYKIAARFSVTPAALYAANRAAVGANPSLIHPGLRLVIPGR